MQLMVVPQASQDEGKCPPYFLDELGEEGLTSLDFAKALRVRHDIVLEKWRRINALEWSRWGWNLTVGTVKTGQRGRPKRIGFMNTEAAKVFLARWDSAAGNEYLKFLLNCERGMGDAKQKIAELEQQLQQARGLVNGPQRKMLPKKSTVTWASGCKKQVTLFGEIVLVPDFQQVDRSKLNDREQRQAEIQHNTRIAEGLLNKTKRLQEEEIIENLPPLARP